MLNPTQRPLAMPRTSNWGARLLYQALLAPEAVLIALTLLVHEALGRPLWSALLGLALVALFGLRIVLLYGARLALGRAAYPLARRLARLTLRLHPWSAEGWSLYASVALNRGDAQTAQRALRQAISCFPGQAALHAALSGALLDAEQVQEARAEALHALAYDACQPTALLHLAGIERSLQASPSLVAELIERGLRAHPEPRAEAPLRCLRAETLLESGLGEMARRELTRVEALLPFCEAPQRAALHCHVGALLAQLEREEEARSHFRAAEQLDPQGRYANIAWRAARA
jgi:tetratricopeptide (TPR) repeat protein